MDRGVQDRRVGSSDPDNNNVLMIENEGADDASSDQRYYVADPLLKPKRVPTMYIQPYMPKEGNSLQCAAKHLQKKCTSMT